MRQKQPSLRVPFPYLRPRNITPIAQEDDSGDDGDSLFNIDTNVDSGAESDLIQNLGREAFFSNPATPVHTTSPQILPNVNAPMSSPPARKKSQITAIIAIMPPASSPSFHPRQNRKIRVSPQ